MIWFTFPTFVPDDQETVIVRLYGFRAPTSATWTAATQSFETPSGLDFPWWIVSKWARTA